MQYKPPASATIMTVRRERSDVVLSEHISTPPPPPPPLRAVKGIREGYPRSTQKQGILW